MGLNNPGGIKGALLPRFSCPITNPGFETGDLTGWVNFRAASVINKAEDPNIPIGNYCVKVYHASAAYPGGVRQNLNCDITDNDKLYVHYWSRSTHYSPYIILSFDGSPACLAAGNNTEWEEHTLCVDVEDCNTIFQIFLVSSDADPLAYYFYFDDLSFYV